MDVKEPAELLANNSDTDIVDLQNTSMETTKKSSVSAGLRAWKHMRLPQPMTTS